MGRALSVLNAANAFMPTSCSRPFRFWRWHAINALYSCLPVAYASDIQEAAMKGRIKIATVAAVAAGAMLIGACGGRAQPAHTTPPAGHSTPTGPRSAATVGPIPTYPGATVSSHAGGFTLLHSDDSVGKVGSFYVDTLAREGWHTVSKQQSEYSVNVVAKRGNEGVTVQVSPTFSGSSISITTYPV